MKKQQVKFDAQFFKDTAEYNYKLGYEKAKEFNLSNDQMNGDRDFRYYSEKDVKEFIKIIKALITYIPDEHGKWLLDEIDKIAGEKLRS